MRTNVEIDEELMQRAIKASGKPTKKATVEEALRLVVQLDRQARAIRELWGIGWEGNLDEMRASRFPDWDKDWESESPLSKKSVA